MNRISGQGWARGGLVLGALFSIAGNIVHTVMSESAVSLAIRIPLAAAWPSLLFVSVEILVRVPWRRKLLDTLGRIVLLLPVGAVTAIVSYIHLHHLMVLAGENGWAAMLGPVGVDGTMIGSTIALLAIRAMTITGPAPAPEPDPEWIPERQEIVTDPIEIPQRGTLPWDQPDANPLADIQEMVARAGRPRRPRGQASEALEKAVRALLDGVATKDAAELHEVGRSTLGRYAKVGAVLRDNPQADIDLKQEKVQPELVAIMRDHFNRERVR